MSSLESINSTSSFLHSERLDKVLIEICTRLSFEVSRSQVQTWIEAGLVSVNGEIKKRANSSVPVGAHITVQIPKIVPSEIHADDIPLSILYEDEAILVISKPSGLVVHPGAGIQRGTLANALSAYFKNSNTPAPERMGIVHRLDKDTSGLLVIGKTALSVMKLSKQFADRSTDKLYLALAYHSPRRAIPDEGMIEKAIGRHPTQRTKMTVRDDGKAALTRWKVIERFHYGALIEVKIETGRTHQIRVHMEYLHTPIVGDTVYGNFQGMPKELSKAVESFHRHALHAWKLTIRHPLSNELVTFEAPLEESFSSLINTFRSYGSI